HSLLDNNPNWFAGRTFLDLTSSTLVEDVFVYTDTLEEDKALMSSRIVIDHTETKSFNGKLVVKTGVWGDDLMNTVVEMPILIAPGKKTFSLDFHIDDPTLWNTASPNLYVF